ncbi:MAG: type IV secretory system conjugative DNA transfer family protein [Pegethrix bostrychoides GSE-TBD4-15B]|jgi:hypothetical protein|uniref:Type IV secretory system conjugative DNA transfer family protein n=1 Tax=Pegethrix bostrychoides GSE-TBD4-15B TaxID=2839662 RepID=A0A951PBM5_9CYAN|nr:type IV secretory system conjugative DNA transfer family protein [Pegethrix bostrychoides GSE-TBD4-15B]
MTTKPRTGSQRYQFKPFEDETHLECICRLALRERTVGAYLLRRGHQFSFVFGFRIPGIHTLLSPEQAEATLARIEAGLKGFRPGDRLRIHLRSFAQDNERQQELESLINTSSSLETQFLLLAQQRSTRMLTQQNERQTKQLYLFATYTIEPGKGTSADRLEKLLAWMIERYDTFKGMKERKEQEHYQQLLERAFSYGYLHWEHLINDRMGLQASLMTAEDLWSYLWQQFNTLPPPLLPQCLSLHDEGGSLCLEEDIQEPLHAVSVLIRGEQGRPSHPKADRQWARVRGKFIGALALESKPAGFISPNHQLYYLWQALADTPDCEVVCELAAADRMMTRMTLQRLTRQNITATHRATEFKNVDVASQVRAKRGIEAQEQIFEGAMPIWVSVLVLVHRDDPETLNEASQKISHAFPQGELIRETEVAWSLWLKSLPIVEGWLLGDDRKQMYLTTEAAGLMPLACTRAVDARGLELITRQGNMPLLIDFVGKHRGILIFGETRSGKSVLASDIFVWALAQGMNVISLDYPKPDGTTTYTDLVKFFGNQGAYFDIGSERNNLFQIPDLRHLPPQQQEERLEDYKEFLVKALNTMVMGTQTEDQLGKRVHTILWQALAGFFANTSVQNRYRAAFEAGFGSADWRQMPTLVDFVETVRELDLGVDSESAREAVATILLELQGWLTSRVGKAISQPSTIRTDARLTVFALRNVGDNIEAAVLALSAQSMAFRKALEVTDSLLAIDESPILFKYNGIAQIIGQVCANGAKAGIRPLIIGQDPDTIANSIAGSQILQNLNTRFIGAIQPNALPSYERFFGYDPAMLLANTDESFRTNPSQLCSHWLVDADARLMHCRHHPSPELLAAVANNPKEQRARQRVLGQYANKFAGYKAFADQYTEAIRAGRSMDSIAPEYTADIEIIQSQQALSTVNGNGSRTSVR